MNEIESTYVIDGVAYRVRLGNDRFDVESTLDGKFGWFCGGHGVSIGKPVIDTCYAGVSTDDALSAVKMAVKEASR